MNDLLHDVLSFVLAQASGLTVATLLGRSLHGVTPRLAFAYYAYHTLTALLCYLYSINNVSDSTLYYADAAVLHSWFSSYGFDKNFIHFIEYPLIHGLGFTFFSIYYLFGLFGYAGMLLVYSAACEQTEGAPDAERGRRLALLLLLLPGQAYWTSDLGKDSVIMLGIGLTIYGLSRLDRRVPLVLAGLVLSFHVRPWIGAMMLGSLGAAFLLGSRANAVIRLLYAAGITGVLVLMIPLVAAAVGLSGSNSLEDAGAVLEKRHGFSTGGSAIDLQSQGLAMGCFTYLFRPLFIDASSAFGLVASFENLAYLLLFLAILWRPGFYAFVARGGSVFKSFLVVLFASLLPLLAYVTPNLGIADRQKTMIMPAAVILFSMYLAQRRSAGPAGTVAAAAALHA